MKTLTKNQQEIINSIQEEFLKINQSKTNRCDDIFAFIDSAVNEKQQYLEQCKVNDAIFEKVIIEKANAICDRINDVLERYGFDCEIRTTHRGRKHIDYFSLQISFNGCFLDGYPNSIKTKCIYIHPNLKCIHNIESYKDSNVTIYDNYISNRSEIKDNDVEMYVAKLIIGVLKSKIN